MFQNSDGFSYFLKNASVGQFLVTDHEYDLHFSFQGHLQGQIQGQSQVRTGYRFRPKFEKGWPQNGLTYISLDSSGQLTQL